MCVFVLMGAGGGGVNTQADVQDLKSLLTLLFLSEIYISGATQLKPVCYKLFSLYFLDRTLFPPLSAADEAISVTFITLWLSALKSNPVL